MLRFVGSTPETLPGRRRAVLRLRAGGARARARRSRRRVQARRRDAARPPRARAPRTRSSPRTAAAWRARGRGRAGAVRQHLREVGGGGDADRAVERAREVDGDLVARPRSAAPMPPALASLTVARSQAPSSTARRASSAVGDALVGGDRDRGPAAARAARSRGRRPAARRARARGGPSRRGARRPRLRRPRSVGIDADPRLRADRLAHGATCSRSSPHPDLQLEVSKAVARPSARPPRRPQRALPRRGSRCSGRGRRGRAEQLPDRHALDLPGEVVQGDVDRGEGLGGRSRPASRR